MLRFACLISLLLLLPCAKAQEIVPTLPDWHLTARPWTPLDSPRDAYLDAVERVARVVATWQAESGAIIDPILEREHQYSTPYFAFAVATLVDAGRDELLNAGVRAMNHATASLAAGNDHIPDQHGEFYIAPLTEALELYKEHVLDETYTRWRDRMRTPLTHIIEGIGEKTNNWRTYAMKGEWLRARAGLVSRDDAIAFIEDAWRHRTQRARILPTRWRLYQDWNGHPQSLAVEAVGRGNLLALALSDYNGPSADEIRRVARAGTLATLLLQDPTGQCPPNGRTDDHVFNDVLYQLQFEAMAEDAYARDDTRLAGQYRRAALLAFHSIDRWQRPPLDGGVSTRTSAASGAGNERNIYAITKNHFDPARRVGYQPASQLGNYTGAVMYHLAEAYLTCRTDIPERPAPAEIGGFVIETDARFGAVVANAGGMQMQINLLGDAVPKYNTWWTPLGVVRFSRAGWDSRLGPSDGARDYESGEAATFAPTWKRGNQWVRLADMAEHYRGTIITHFTHPLLVKLTVLYAPVTGVGGPSFYHDFTITPDGVLTELRPANPHTEFGLTLPVLVNDGRPLDVTVADEMVSTRYSDEPDEQHFLIIHGQDVTPAKADVLGPYGYLRPVRVQAKDGLVRVFVYPRGPDDPTARDVLEKFDLTADGFTSPLARIEDTRYIGRTAAGGFADALDLGRDRDPEIHFRQPCNVFVALRHHRITAVETDRDTTAYIDDKEIALRKYTPHAIDDEP